MARKRITMQDIAQACGLSRNTVSKVFNDRGAVPEETRRLVLDKARQLGYTQLPAESGQGRSIALLTQHKLLSHNFGAFFITSFTDQISRAGYTLKMYEISRAEIREKRLPPHLDLEETAGILGIELFDRPYLESVCALGKPTVFVDGYPHAAESSINCDFVSMENLASETALVGRMIRSGAKKIGFVGDRNHCNSFYERWVGCCSALREAGLPIREDLSILAEDGEYYGDPAWLLRQLEALPEIPDGFACANDYLALHLMTALKKLGLSIPGDVMVAGFDGSMEASVVTPALATARIPSAEIGRLAASVLAQRIRQPDFPYHWTYVKTTPIWGESIGSEK
ncbi:MAG: LacI family DNA-binding transcriptional regulator [Oscillospiraceae bacterium]|nr:LacI family DNA-binding transcriptional regulator [Oscillospiraceae bacterium]